MSEMTVRLLLAGSTTGALAGSLAR